MTHWEAWQTLRFDRQFGALGGETPISFVALDTYARRYGIDNVEFETFLILVGNMDDEYLQHVARKTKAEEAERKRRENH
jgi:hypothetical protein